jgi:hypothetical protein
VTSIVGVVIALVVTGSFVLATHGPDATPGPPCRVVAGARVYRLDRNQVANAVIVTDSARELGLAHHAVTVALAAALQESQLRNLTTGDRDSLGLFQQRPSQGWGTPTQILDPRHASVTFLRALARVGQWQTMPVTEAAQRVQRSATPTAYARSESEARAIARATTGELPGTLTCS